MTTFIRIVPMFFFAALNSMACTATTEESHPSATDATKEMYTPICALEVQCVKGYPFTQEGCVSQQLQGVSADQSSGCTRSQLDACVNDAKGMSCQDTTTGNYPVSCKGC